MQVVKLVEKDPRIAMMQEMLYEADRKGVKQYFGRGLVKCVAKDEIMFCAVGAVLHLQFGWDGEYYNKPPSDYMNETYGKHLLDYVVKLNDQHHMTFRQIADHLEHVSYVGPILRN